MWRIIRLNRDPTGHFPLISWDRFVGSVNAYKTNQRDLNIWAGESHDTLQGNYLAINSSTTIKFQNLILEAVNTKVDSRPENNPEIIRSKD